MEGINWLISFNEQAQIKQVMDMNEETERFGLALSGEDTELLIKERRAILEQEGRVEFGQSVLPKIIMTFCDSGYIMQDNYVQSLIRLQEIFYYFKNEMDEEITDDELLNFMKEQFESVCFGDFQYLEGTCLEIFSEAIRAGYQGHRETEGKGRFGDFDIVVRWDRELYLEALKNQF